MVPRVYAPDAGREGDTIELPPDEARHLAQVLRVAVGSPVRVFDGRGREFQAVVDRVGRSGVTVRLEASRPPVREAAVAVTLAQAVLKGDRMDDVVRDAVMLGVAAVQPIVTSRTALDAAALRRGHRRDRWERVAIASAKQCGRATVPPVFEPRLFEEASADPDIPGGLMLVEPGVEADVAAVWELPGMPPPAATLFVGPEGGWSAEEIAAGGRTCRLLTLGGRTLRADAAAMVAIAALFTVWRER